MLVRRLCVTAGMFQGQRISPEADRLLAQDTTIQRDKGTLSDRKIQPTGYRVEEEGGTHGEASKEAVSLALCQERPQEGPFLFSGLKNRSIEKCSRKCFPS